jgi:hypothetical protein
MKENDMSKLVVDFGEHISHDQITSMVSSIAAYGNVYQGAPDREFAIEVFHASKLPKLKRCLTEWERYGFIRWSELEDHRP